MPEIKSPLLFELFWKEYGKKVGREAAIKAWNKLTDEDRKAATDNAHAYANATPEKKYRPHPTTYLNQKRWTDDLGDVALSNVTPQINRITTKMDQVNQTFKKVMNEKIDQANEREQRRIN